MFEDGFDLIGKIFEIRVEKDADLLEFAAKKQFPGFKKKGL